MSGSPSDAEVARVTERIQRLIAGLIDRRGLGPQSDRDESDAIQKILDCLGLPSRPPPISAPVPCPDSFRPF